MSAEHARAPDITGVAAQEVNMKPSRLLFLLPLAALSCAQAPVRRLSVIDEMPPAPEQASATQPAGDFVTFYPKVPSALNEKPDLSRYGIECSVPIVTHEGYFTLAMRDDRGEALFILTEKPVTSLAKTLSFRISEQGTMDWGFVYDRNGDGWADYIAFLLGAWPVGTPQVLAQLPRRPAVERGVKYSVPPEEAEMMVAHFRLVFIHYVDDGFDGKTDAIVSALEDPDHGGWIKRAVLRSRDHSQIVDEDWVFVQDIAAREGPIPRDSGGRFVKLEGLGNVQEKHLEHFAVLDRVNSGLRSCRIPRGVLPRG